MPDPGEEERAATATAANSATPPAAPQTEVAAAPLPEVEIVDLDWRTPAMVVGACIAIGAVAGVFSLPVAVLVHEISEFIVIGSGLRLLRAPSEGAAA